MSKAIIKRYKSQIHRRAAATRARMAKSGNKMRLSVHKSNKFVYAQIIDLGNGITVAGVKGTNPETVGKNIAEKAIKAKVAKVVFDRGAYSYHGQVKLVAEAARKAGLEF